MCLYCLHLRYLCCCCCCCGLVASVVSDPVRPHRWQPTRLLCPWDSQGENTGVGCISCSNAWKWKVKVKLLSCVWLLAIPWAAAYQAPLSMGFSRQEYWNGLPLSSPKVFIGMANVKSITLLVFFSIRFSVLFFSFCF